MEILGIDIGGSGIKGAPVDLEKGQLLTKRYRISTPKPNTPPPVADVIAKIAAKFDWKGPIGCTFPGVVKRGVIHTAANLDDAWVGVNAGALFGQATGCRVRLLNDADAAGIAEMTFGVGQGGLGTVILLTFGTGIGSALFVQGILIPNTEFGHLELWGNDAELKASDRARKADNLSWKSWAQRVSEYLNHLDLLFSPDLIILGGGVSNKPDRFMKYLEVKVPIVTAELKNNAGIVGAALHAQYPIDDFGHSA